ncbi:hypothetical protein [Desulfofarcimen acetoxidans]|uniref:hypothetical protein n=1 Tax=Desulfofarcimen acetoxidans TaxID=58138 RepID=UPI00019E4F49|nr:hypothetical protein [Desulfofarcimen acetoxidans]
MAQVRRRGPSKYIISIYLGRDQEGKRIYHNETFYGTPTNAKLRAAELEVELKKRNGPKVLANINVDKYLDQWLEGINESISERTFEKYSWHVRRLKMIVGHLQLYNLNVLELQQCLQNLNDIAPRTKRDIYATLKTAMRQALVWGIISSDPTVGLRTPKNQRKERQVLNQEELKLLLKAAKGYRYYPVIRLLAVTFHKAW